MSADSIIAIIPAGGLGKRMKSQKPKQFLTLNDEPILIITLRALAAAERIDKFIIPSVDLVYTRKIIASSLPELDGKIEVIKGGKTRQESINNALELIETKDCQPELILIHDAVRALVQPTTIHNVIAKAREVGGAIAAVKVTDTLKQANEVQENGHSPYIKKNVSRDHMWQAQTPQVFKREVLLEAYDKAKLDHFEGTDSAGLVERINKPVALVEGLRTNIKITNPRDLLIAESFLDTIGKLYEVSND